TARAAISGPVSVSITAAGGGIVQLIGGNLDLRDVQYTSAKTLALDGGRLRSLMGNNLWAGNIINDIGSTVEVGPGSVLSLAGGISGRAGFTKIGFGTLALEGPNTFSGGFNVNEGVLQLNYTRNNVGKLSDVSGLTLGGGRKGATLDIVGNAAGSTEKVLNTTLSLGLNSITRSDPNSTTKLTSNNFIINQGATLDVQYNAAQGSAGVVVTTDRPNDGAAIGNSTGILGAWATVNLSDWAANSNNGAAPNDGSIIPYTGYKINTWEGPFANTTVTASTTQTGGTTYSLRFAAPVSTITTLVGDNTLRGGGILQAPAAGAVSNIITGGRLVLGNNNQGGNLVIQQHDTAGSLQINSDIANAKDIFVNDAISYGFNTSPQNNANNRFYLPSTLHNIEYYTGMPVLGQNVRPGSVINGFQALGATAATFNISQNIASKLVFATGEQKIAVLANLRPDSVPNRIHLIFDTTSNFKPYPLPTVGQKVVGLGVPPDTFIAEVESETDYLLSNPVPTQVNTGLFLSPRPPFIANLAVGGPRIVQLTDASDPSPALVANQSITGPGIPAGTKIVSIQGLKLFTVNKDLTPASGVALTVGSAPPPATTFPITVAPNGVTNQIHIATNTPGNSTTNLPSPPLVAGQLITGPGIPENTVISSVIGTTPAGTDFLLNNNLIVATQYATVDMHPGAVAKQIRITDTLLPNPPLEPGYYVTGPNIPGAPLPPTVIVSISPDGRDLVLNNPVPVATGVKLAFSAPQILTATLRPDEGLNTVSNKIRITDAALPNPPLAVGQTITGPHIPLNTTIIAVLTPVLGPTEYVPSGTDFLLSNDVPAIIGEVVRVTPLAPPTIAFTADLVVGGDARQLHITDDQLPSQALTVGTPIASANIPDGTVITDVLSDRDFLVSNDMVATTTPVVVSTTINASFQMWGELTVGNVFTQATVKNAPAWQVHLSVGNNTGLAEDQLVSGPGIPAGATIASLVGTTDFTFRFPNSHAFTIVSGSSVRSVIGDIGFANQGFQFHLTQGETTGLVAGAQVIGDDIQPGTTIFGALIGGGTDFNVNRSIFAPVEDIIIQSRNGLLKTGDGVAQLGGSNTFTGPITITGGALSVSQVTNGGQAGSLGASTVAAGNITIGGGTLQYTGDSTSVNRGFTINEVGGIDVASRGTTLNFTGNLSGGVGAALGTLQKYGQGTLQLSRTVTLGGATNFGGFDVGDGTLLLKYNNPNDGSPNDRFASTAAALTLSGGKFELAGTPDNIPLTGSNPSEDRSQALRGQFTVNTGASQLWATGARNSAITLTLQDAATPLDVMRQSGGTVLFVENPNGGTANIVLALNQNFTSKPLTWATYWDPSGLAQPGVNNFAAIEPSDYGVVSADDTRLYTITSNVTDWGDVTETVSESGTSFAGTVESDTGIYAMRLFSKSNTTVNISNTGGAVVGSQARLQIKGGAILATTNSGNFSKVIQGGKITSGFATEGSSVYDLIIHNYNPAHALEIKSEIVDNNFGTPTHAVNLVITGTGTTTLYGNNLSTSPNANKNSYTGTTFLNGGVLRLANVGALPGGIGLNGGTSNLVFDGGVLGLSSDFTRGLGTGISQVQWTGNGGFAAYGNDVNVNLGGQTSPLTVVWGAGSFVPDSAELRFSSADATNSVRFLNPVNLGGVGRTVNVADGFAAIDAEMTGLLTGNGGSLVKTGQGTLRLNNSVKNLQTGGAVLAQGKLITNANGLGVGALGIGNTDGTTATDALVLELRGGSFDSLVTVGNKNSTAVTSINAAASPTLNGSMTLGRQIFFGPQGGRKITINGGVNDSLDSNSLLTGNGGFTVVDGGVVLLNGAGNLGSG
ncbi:MAG: outer rane autotransporter, partial [Verrucomicrobiaceae bacterium]|nr:outer rane autotransporter [Verrucomicrobiaceae bacterium]